MGSSVAGGQPVVPLQDKGRQAVERAARHSNFRQADLTRQSSQQPLLTRDTIAVMTLDLSRSPLGDRTGKFKAPRRKLLEYLPPEPPC